MVSQNSKGGNDELASTDLKKVVWPIEKDLKSQVSTIDNVKNNSTMSSRSSWASIAKNPAAYAQEIDENQRSHQQPCTTVTNGIGQVQ